MAFKKGQDPNRARGGAREGAGRKPEEFKRICSEIASMPEFFSWAKDVFEGKMVVPRATKEGFTRTEANVTERAFLWDKIAAYGIGKPVQMVELGEETRANLLDIVTRARVGRGLKS